MYTRQTYLGCILSYRTQVSWTNAEGARESSRCVIQLHYSTCTVCFEFPIETFSKVTFPTRPGAFSSGSFVVLSRSYEVLRTTVRRSNWPAELRGHNLHT